MPFHLGAPELVVLLALCLLIFGAGRLPEVGAALGKGVRDFRKAMGEAGSEDKKLRT